MSSSFFYYYSCFIINLSFIQARYIRLPTVNASELSPIGTPIIQLLDVLPPSNWEFQFLTQFSIKSYFLLDTLKGTIIIKRPLDREDLCQSNICSCSNECLFKLEINAISDTSTHILSLPLLIIDENDNHCYFPQEIYYLNITENVRLNTRISLPIAYDPDLPPNNVQWYGFVGNNSSEFRLENHFTPSMILLQPLDRELVAKYQFHFCAYEGIPEQQRSCCTKLIVTILDVNDNSPRFQGIPSIVQLSEFTSIGTEVIQIKAIDPDEGLNGQIRYSFSQWTLNDPTIDQTFHLNPDNGSMILLKTLDYEKRTNYELQIQARDLGPDSIPTYATVILQVIDENDCLPELFLFPSPDVQLINNSLIYIFENISPHTSILYITVSDHDTNENGRVSMELLSSNSTLRLQKLNNDTYSLLTNRIFDREEHSSYSFSLLIYDHGKPPHSMIKKFDLVLLDINDCFPVFDPTMNYSFSLAENNPQNFPVQTIRVFDLDQNDQITLHLEFPENNDDRFQLNEQNQLIIKRTLDYEDQSSYHFTLIAEDLVGHRTSMPVSIYLNDVNDNPVRFRTNFTQFKIQENLPIGTHFGLIYAEDKDKTDQIIYQIHPDDFIQTKHLIELNTNGSLYTKGRMTRDEMIRFRTLANDSLHTDSIRLEIRITKSSILLTRSPYCLMGYRNESVQFESERNLSFSFRNPSSSELILFPNGTMIIPSKSNKYSFDIYLQDENSFSIFENFLLLSQTHALIQFDQKLLFVGLFGFLLLVLIVCYYLQQSTRKKFFDQKLHFTPSFSSLFSPPSPQFTPMTIISSSTNEQTNQSASVSNSSSSTYIKMSRSFDDEMI